MKPKLPTIPRSNLPIEALDPAWVRQLLRCVEYAMEHPKGDGFTILNSTPGILQAVVPGRQGVSSVPKKEDLSDSGNPNFKLSYADGVLSCSGGFFFPEWRLRIYNAAAACSRPFDGWVYLFIYQNS